MLHFATPSQKEKYLRPLCDGKIRSCFAMTEPEAAGSDPTQIKTSCGKSRRQLGHQRPQMVYLGRAWRQVRHRDREDRSRRRSAAGAQLRVHRRSAQSGLQDRARHRHDGGQGESLRDQCSRTCVVPADSDARRARRGPQARAGAARSGAPRALHAMDRQRGGRARDAAKRAMERSVQGGKLVEKQGDPVHDVAVGAGAVQAKLMVLHAAYLIENNLPFRHEVSMTKYHVANMLWTHPRSRDPGSRRARIFLRHATGRSCCVMRARHVSSMGPTKFISR